MNLPHLAFETPRSRHYDGLMEQYAKSFAGHQLLKCDEIEPHRALLRIGRPASSMYLTEIAISLGYIIVWGDIQTCAFRGGDGGSWRSQLAWLGQERPDYHYCASKACIGTCFAVAYETDTDIARADILDLRRERVVTAEQARAGWDAIGYSEHVSRVRDVMYNEGADGESIGSLGEVVSSTVLCAIAALRKAHQLVREGTVAA